MLTIHLIEYRCYTGKRWYPYVVSDGGEMSEKGILSDDPFVSGADMPSRRSDNGASFGKKTDRHLNRLPVWVFYIIIAFVLSITYVFYLQGKISEIDTGYRNLERENSNLEAHNKAQVKLFASERAKLLEEIETLKRRIREVEGSINDVVDKANKEAIDKLEEERQKWQQEIARIIAFYQKKFKSSVTPKPPPRKKRK